MIVRFGLAILSLLIICFAKIQSHAENMTVERYIQEHGDADTRVFLSGRAKIEGHRLYCGNRPILIDNNFRDYGGAFPGLLILNQKRLKGLPKAVKLYIFAHECGHQFRGRDEAAADCYAVKRGRREGWLNEKGMKQVCAFMSPHIGGRMHPPGPERCKLMRKCFREAFRNRDSKRNK